MHGQDHSQLADSRPASGPANSNARVRIMDLAEYGEQHKDVCDVLIVGGGPAGLSVARGLDGSKKDIVILESGGLEESAETEALNEVVATEGTWNSRQALRRADYHKALTRHWTHARQGYGVRCRSLGGSTASWAGKSAAFDEIDFAKRDWVPNSGWPISRSDLDSAQERALKILNLGPNCCDDDLWALMRRNCPDPRPDPEVLRSFFWQFSRSTIDPMDVLRAGREFLRDAPTPCRVLTGATVVELLTDESGRRATGAVVADKHGIHRTVLASTVVLAASAIENARLLLVSRKSNLMGLGNVHGTVGRYLMDHPCAVVARFKEPDIVKMSELFGFYGLRNPAGVTMYMRGLAPTPEVQAAEGLLNCAAFMPGERAPDDPWDAAKRLLKRKSDNYISDALAILRSPKLVATGLGRMALQSPLVPKGISQFAVNQVIRFRPNLAAEEYLTRGLPHKLTGLEIQTVCEQVPDPENRVTLSEKTDKYGTQLPLVRWRVGEAEMRTLARSACLVANSFEKAGMPVPVVDNWVTAEKYDEAAVIDMAHTAGTTRMSEDPRTGVVDRNCQVHGVDGLFVAGASVFPTSGHANPTLMIVSLATRLADHISGRP